MVELKIYLSDGLNEKFRRIAMTVFGYGRGSLSRAAEEAFAKWCEEHDERQRATPTLEPKNEPVQQTAQGINPDERSQNEEKHDAKGDNSSTHSDPSGNASQARDTSKGSEHNY